MAPSIIRNNAIQGEVFLPGQIFVFGGFALRANSLVHLEQIDSYALGHQVRFGNLNYTVDIRGDLIFNRFGPMPGAPDCHDVQEKSHYVVFDTSENYRSEEITFQVAPLSVSKPPELG